MSKSTFLAELAYHLRAIPEKERQEFIEDYVNHFEFGMQEGKTEELLAQELGAPQEIAVEIVAEYNRTHLAGSGANQKQSHPLRHTAKLEKSRSVFTIIGLFLLNFVCAVAPLLLSLWATWLCLALAFVIAILSPIVAVVDYVANDYYNIGTLFFSFIVCGVSIFASFGTLYVGKKFRTMTIAYWKWNIRLIKGAE